MLTWLANLLSGGRLDRTERRVEELERERDYAWGEFRAESERTEWQAQEHLHWRELHHRAVQQRDQAGKDLARATRDAEWFRGQAQHSSNLEHIQRGHVFSLDRSRRGWRWLYEAKCAEWEATRHLRDSWRIIAGNSFQQLTQERGLRDGWEQTAGELQAQVRQGDNNLQRVEAERDEGGAVA